MKKIDYIYKNFDVIAFSKNLKKIKKSECSELSDFLTSIVLESTRDISQIKKEIKTIKNFLNIKNKLFY